MKHLVGKNPTKEVDFNGGKVKIRKLSAAAVRHIQSMAKENGDEPTTEQQMALMRYAIDSSVEGAKDVTAEEFEDFPLEELNSLSAAILEFSGMGNAQTQSK